MWEVLAPQGRGHYERRVLVYHTQIRGVALSLYLCSQADYRGDGNVELICCSVDGEVRGYLSASTVQPGGVGGAGREEWAGQDHWKQLESLAQRKQVTTPTLVIVFWARDGMLMVLLRDGANPSLRSEEVYTL